MQTAQLWDSYRETMNQAMAILKPERCFEWGPGVSSDIILASDPELTLESVEHDGRWFDKIKGLADERFHPMLEPDTFLYPLVQGRFDFYDLIFIDGILREKCLMTAIDKLSDNGVVILHDAERTSYQDFIKEYAFCVWTDNGHTACLTNKTKIFMKIKDIGHG